MKLLICILVFLMPVRGNEMYDWNGDPVYGDYVVAAGSDSGDYGVYYDPHNVPQSHEQGYAPSNGQNYMKMPLHEDAETSELKIKKQKTKKPVHVVTTPGYEVVKSKNYYEVPVYKNPYDTKVEVIPKPIKSDKHGVKTNKVKSKTNSVKASTIAYDVPVYKNEYETKVIQKPHVKPDKKAVKTDVKHKVNPKDKVKPYLESVKPEAPIYKNYETNVGVITKPGKPAIKTDKVKATPNLVYPNYEATSGAVPVYNGYGTKVEATIKPDKVVKPGHKTEGKPNKQGVKVGHKTTTEVIWDIDPRNKEAPSTMKSDHKCEDCTAESPDFDIDHENLKTAFLETIDTKFRSLVFNPSAQPQDKFQQCKTPSNETGNCRYVQHCLLPNLIGSIDKFMESVCIINDRFIGICCPEFPAVSIKVKWDNVLLNSSTEKQEVPECGIGAKTRIVGGTKADPKAWPWMAALLAMSSGQFYCGGALINSRYVLTAAHCTFSVPRNQILVRLGEYDFKASDESPGDYPVIEIKRHGQYSRRTLRNDIALLKLSRTVTFNQHVGTICLPEEGSFEGEMATLAGWGNIQGGGPSSDVLLEASFPVLSNKNCSNEHGLSVPDISICTRSTPMDQGACNGDSGGPLMLLNEDTKRWKAIGVVSWGRRGCDPKFPTVYARVSKYVDWIKMHAV